MANWMCKVVSGMFSLNGWWGINYQEKLIVQSTSEAQKPTWRGYSGSLLAELKRNPHFVS